MAALSKKVDTRVSRCLDQLLELRMQCSGDAEVLQLNQCIRLLRDARVAAEGVFRPSQAARTAPIQAPASGPAAAPAPVSQPAPGHAPRAIAQDSDAAAAPADPAAIKALVDVDWSAGHPDDVPPGHPWHGQPDTKPAGHIDQHEPKPAQHWTTRELTRTDIGSDGDVDF